MKAVTAIQKKEKQKEQEKIVGQHMAKAECPENCFRYMYTYRHAHLGFFWKLRGIPVSSTVKAQRELN